MNPTQPPGEPKPGADGWSLDTLTARYQYVPALTVGVSPVEVKEIVYQAVPYVGMAKVFDFIHATNEVLTERGFTLPLPGQSTTTPDNRAEKGLAIEKQIVGSAVVDKLYATAPDDELHFQRHLSANCFGEAFQPSFLLMRTC